MRKIARLAIIWLLLGISFSGASPLQPLPTNDSPAAALLNMSYGFGTDASIEEQEQLRYLGDLVIIAPGIASSENVIKWSDELINRSRKSQVISGWDKVANQKLAVEAISKVKPIIALDRFLQIGPPQPNRENRLPEDVRAFGARVLFVNYLRNSEIDAMTAVKTLRETAKGLATDGAYPFHAISLVIGELTVIHPDQHLANAIFQDAHDAYHCGAKVENEDTEFLTLLQNTRNVVSKSLLEQGVVEFIKHLTDPNCKKPNPDQFDGVIITTDGQIPFTSEDRALLFRAYSTLKDISPNKAAEVQGKYPEFQNADAAILQVAGSYTKKTLSQQDRDQRQRSGIEQSLLRGIRNLRESNPQLALDMAQSLTNQSSRLIAISSVLRPLLQADPNQAKQLYADQLSSLESLNDDRQRLEATTNVAQAAYDTQDTETFQYLATRVFSEGITQFTSAPSRTPIESRAGYKPLTELVEFAAANNVGWLLDQVQQLSDLKLKAHLLMYAARGLSKRTPSSNS